MVYRLPLRAWVYTRYLQVTDLKDNSSHKLHREIGVSQATAWDMLPRIRKAFDDSDDDGPFDDPAKHDETYVGGSAKKMHAHKRAEISRHGCVDKTAVVGIQDRDPSQVVEVNDCRSLQDFAG